MENNRMRIKLVKTQGWLGRAKITIHVPPLAEYDGLINAACVYVNVLTLRSELHSAGYSKDSLLWVLDKVYRKDGSVDSKRSISFHKYVDFKLATNTSLKALFMLANAVQDQFPGDLRIDGYTDTDMCDKYRMLPIVDLTLNSQGSAAVAQPAIVDESADEFVTKQLMKMDDGTGLQTVHVARKALNVSCVLYPQLVCETPYDGDMLRRLLKQFADKDKYRFAVAGGTIRLSFMNGVPMTSPNAAVEDFVKTEKDAIIHMDVLARAKEALDQIGVTGSDLAALKEAYDADGVR